MESARAMNNQEIFQYLDFIRLKFKRTFRKIILFAKKFLSLPEVECGFLYYFCIYINLASNTCIYIYTYITHKERKREIKIALCMRYQSQKKMTKINISVMII